MNILKREALVPYSAHQMYEMVNQIEDYPRFLPWCQQSEIIDRNEAEVLASLEVTWKGVHKKFSTRNLLFPHDRIEMRLEKGPLTHLEGIWLFEAIDEKLCQVKLELEFEFGGNLLDRLFQPVFAHIADTLVEAFCKRAVELYG